jgi:hypothetical protein
MSKPLLLPTNLQGRACRFTVSRRLQCPRSHTVVNTKQLTIARSSRDDVSWAERCSGVRVIADCADLRIVLTPSPAARNGSTPTSKYDAASKPASRTASAAAKQQAYETCPAKAIHRTGSGSNSPSPQPTCSPGCKPSASTATSPSASPPPCATDYSTSPHASSTPVDAGTSRSTKTGPGQPTWPTPSPDYAQHPGQPDRHPTSLPAKDFAEAGRPAAQPCAPTAQNKTKIISLKP